MGKPELYIGPKAHFVPTRDKATGRIRTYKNPKDKKTGMRIKSRNSSTRLGGNEKKVRQFTQYRCVGCEELPEKKCTLINIDGEDRFVNVNPEDVHHFCDSLPDSEDEAPGDDFVLATTRAILATRTLSIAGQPPSSAHSGSNVSLAEVAGNPGMTSSTTKNQDPSQSLFTAATYSNPSTKEEAIGQLEQALQGNPGELHLPNSLLQLALSDTVYQEIYEMKLPNEYTTIGANLLRRCLEDSSSASGTNGNHASRCSTADLKEYLCRIKDVRLIHRDDYVVLCDFLRASGILDFVDPRQIMYYLASSFFTLCSILNSVFLKRADGCRYANPIGFCGEELSADDIKRRHENFYGTRVLYVKDFVEHEMEYYSEYMQLINKLSDSRLDQAEVGSLKLIILARYAQTAFPATSCPGLSALLDSVFRSLMHHCEENYMDGAVRMDVIVQLVHNLEEHDRVVCEHAAKHHLVATEAFVADHSAATQEWFLTELARCRFNA